MADRNKFEEMLERLINEDREGAEELFHEIVVEKSRDIYESLLESDLDELEEADKDEEDDDAVEEAAKDDDKDEDDEDLDENFNLDEFEVEGDDDMGMGGDPTDDMMSDLGGDDEGDMDMDMDDEGDDDIEDRVVDLEDALDDLKAEFEKMMAGDDGDEESDEDDMDMDMDDDEGEEGEEKEAFNFGEAEEDEEVDEAEEDETEKSATETMREYVEKVTATMGDNGQNTKSAVAGKNDMGGTTANIAKGGTEAGVEANKGQLKGSSVFKGTPKEDNMGNVNVPGGKASKSMKAQPKGHGAEKKGQGETATNKKSTVGSR